MTAASEAADEELHLYEATMSLTDDQKMMEQQQGYSYCSSHLYQADMWAMFDEVQILTVNHKMLREMMLDMTNSP